MTNFRLDHNTSDSKTAGLTITSIAKTKWKSRFITKMDALSGVKPPMKACTSLARSPDSHSLLRTVWTVASAVIIRFWSGIRRKYLSLRFDVTRDMPLRGLLFVLPVCWRRITMLEMVSLYTLKCQLRVILTEAWPRRSCKKVKFSEWQIAYFCWQHN